MAMVDYQNNVLEAIKTIVNTVSSVLYIGEFPADEGEAIATQKKPACLIKYDGEDAWLADSNLSITPTLRMMIRVYTERKQPYSLLKNCLAIVNDINDAMLTDLSLGGVVDNTIFEGISPIEYEADSAIYELNYSISLRVLRS